jgi:hypothetical protein
MSLYFSLISHLIRCEIVCIIRVLTTSAARTRGVCYFSKNPRLYFKEQSTLGFFLAAGSSSSYAAEAEAEAEAETETAEAEAAAGGLGLLAQMSSTSF